MMIATRGTKRTFQRLIDGLDPSEAALVADLRADRDEAWQRFTVRYRPLIHLWCRRFKLQPEDAADVVQDVFQLVAANIHRFRSDRPGSSFQAWLRTLTLNRLRDNHRRNRLRAISFDGNVAAEVVGDTGLQAESDGGHAKAARVHAAVDVVREECGDRAWEAFQLTAFQDLTSREAAEKLGMKPGAVRMAKQRILRRLREQLESSDA